MKVIYTGYMSNKIPPFSEWNWEVQEAVRKALELIEDKTGFKTYHETWRNCELHVTVGHNIYTTSIHIRPPERALYDRRKKWHNGYAYFCNGVFWASISRIKVELI